MMDHMAHTAETFSVDTHEGQACSEQWLKNVFAVRISCVILSTYLLSAASVRICLVLLLVSVDVPFSFRLLISISQIFNHLPYCKTATNEVSGLETLK